MMPTGPWGWVKSVPALLGHFYTGGNKAAVRRPGALWLLIGALAVAVLAIWGGSAVSVVSEYNDTGAFSCKWWHSANTLMEPEYRLHPVYPPTGTYLTAFNDAISDWDGSDTGQTAHTIGVQNVGVNGPYGKTNWRCFTFGKRSFTHAYISSGQVPSTASRLSNLRLPFMNPATISV